VSPVIIPDTETSLEEIERLLDAAFGPDRRARTAYRFREGVAPVAGLGFVARHDDALTGSIRFWPLRMEAADGAVQPALLLGPLAVAPERRGLGLGMALLQRGLAEAAAQGHERIFLIGDAAYYARAGFRPVLPAQCRMPGPVEPERVLVWTASPKVKLPESFTLTPLRMPAEI